tara:strand:- start:607 stop:1548 length:942 start_codon:yes stop_codon:yes gene_type:complete
MEEIKQQIMIARPNLRPITITNYMSQLNHLSHAIDGGALDHLGFLIDVDKTMTYLEKRTLNTQNTYLTSIIVALTSESPRTPEIDELVKEYRDIFAEKKSLYKDTLGSRKKTEKEKEQWKSLKDLHQIRENLKYKVLAHHIPEKEGLTYANQKILRKYVIASLYTLQPPRRNIYATTLLISTNDFKKLRKQDFDNNYLVFSKNFKNMYFYFGHQKSKLVDNPKVGISSELKKVLRIFLKFNHKNKFLLIDKSGKQLTPNALTHQLNEIFGMGTSMLRKIYISKKTKNYHTFIDKLAKQMGHSAQTAKNFYLKD